jgi:hypothetical protein
MTALQRGDTLVCAFTEGREKNWISLSPDRKIVVLERASAGKIELRSPYVCTIKAVGKPSADGTPRSYVAHVDHPLGLRDYDVILDADFQRCTLVLGLKFPTKFTSLCRKEVAAQVDEQYVPARNGSAESFTLTLRHGALSRSIELSRDEALRRGLRFNHFVRVPPPSGPIDPAIRHPAARRAPASWAPTLMDHTGYLLRSTAQLLEDLPRALESVPEASLLAMAQRRVLEVATLHGYEAVPPESPDHVSLEHALTGLARLACLPTPEARTALAVAEARLSLRRARQLPIAHVAGILNMAAAGFQVESDGRISCTLREFLHCGQGRTSGAWAMCNLDVHGGRVHFAPEQVRALLADRVQAHVMAEACPTPPDDRVAPLRAALSDALAELTHVRSSERLPSLVLEAIPPCVAHSLKAALKRSLFEAEAFNAGSLLCRTGMPSRSVNQALHGVGQETPGELRTANGSRARTAALQTPSCRINRELGICAWTCEGVSSPAQYYAIRAKGVSP